MMTLNDQFFFAKVLRLLFAFVYQDNLHDRRFAPRQTRPRTNHLKC